MTATQTDDPPKNATTTAEVLTLLNGDIWDAMVCFQFAPGVCRWITMPADEARQLVRRVSRDWRFNAWVEETGQGVEWTRQGRVVMVEYVGDWK
jgi:hypothetical protein